jgi:membrane associated rhomboid family serine protease
MIPLKDENPSRTTPVVTLALIALNLAAFIYELSLGAAELERLIFVAGIVPYEITRMVDIGPAAAVPIPLTMITGMFLHGGPLHLAGNMLYLWIFGNNVEDSMGHVRFLGFYLLCGFVASLIHILAEPDSTLPMIGASGAIAGVLGAYALLFPRARIWTLVFMFFFVRMVSIPAYLLLGFWFIMQIASIGRGGQVAWVAHVGGFAAGALLVRLFTERYRYPGRR